MPSLHLLIHGFSGRAENMGSFRSILEQEGSKAPVAVPPIPHSVVCAGVDRAAVWILGWLETQGFSFTGGTAGETITHLSITAYSLGGLVARFLVALLRHTYPCLIIDQLATFTTPHVGLPPFATSGSVYSWVGERVLGRAGRQLYLIDKDHLLELMHSNPVFTDALLAIQQFDIYANAVNDWTVPWFTGAIGWPDPFLLPYPHLTDSKDLEEIELEPSFIDKYEPLLHSITLRSKPILKTSIFSALASFFKPIPLHVGRTWKIPFPLTLLVYLSTPIFIVGILIWMVYTPLELYWQSSRHPLKWREFIDKDDRWEKALTEFMRAVRSSPHQELSVVAAEDTGAIRGENWQRPAPIQIAFIHRFNALFGSPPSSGGFATSSESQTSESSTQSEPGRLSKFTAYMPPPSGAWGWSNAHPALIVLDPANPSHKRGEGVLRMWRDRLGLNL